MRKNNHLVYCAEDFALDKLTGQATTSVSDHIAAMTVAFDNCAQLQKSSLTQRIIRFDLSSMGRSHGLRLDVEASADSD